MPDMSRIGNVSQDYLDDFLKLWGGTVKWFPQYQPTMIAQKQKFAKKIGFEDWTDILACINEAIKDTYDVQSDTFMVKGKDIHMVNREALKKREAKLDPYVPRLPAKPEFSDYYLVAAKKTSMNKVKKARSRGTPKGPIGVSTGVDAGQEAEEEDETAKSQFPPKGPVGMSKGVATRLPGAAQEEEEEAKSPLPPKGPVGMSKGVATRLPGAAQEEEEEAKSPLPPKGPVGMSKGVATRLPGAAQEEEAEAKSPLPPTGSIGMPIGVANRLPDAAQEEEGEKKNKKKHDHGRRRAPGLSQVEVGPDDLDDFMHLWAPLVRKGKHVHPHTSRHLTRYLKAMQRSGPMRGAVEWTALTASINQALAKTYGVEGDVFMAEGGDIVLLNSEAFKGCMDKLTRRDRQHTPTSGDDPGPTARCDQVETARMSTGVALPLPDAGQEEEEEKKKRDDGRGRTPSLSQVDVQLGELKKFAKIWAPLVKTGRRRCPKAHLTRYMQEFMEMHGEVEWTALVASINTAAAEWFGVKRDVFMVSGDDIVMLHSESFPGCVDNFDGHDRQHIPNFGDDPGPPTQLRVPAGVAPSQVFGHREESPSRGGPSAAQLEQNQGKQGHGQKEEDVEGEGNCHENMCGNVHGFLAKLSACVRELYMFLASEHSDEVRNAIIESPDLRKVLKHVVLRDAHSEDGSKALVTVGFCDRQSREACMRISQRDREEFGCTGIAHYQPDDSIKQRRVYFYNKYKCQLSLEQIHEVAESFADGLEVHVQREKYAKEPFDGTPWNWTTTKTDVLRKGYIEFAEEAHADNLFGALGEEEHPRYGRSQVLSQSYLRQFGVRNAIAFQRDKDYVAP